YDEGQSVGDLIAAEASRTWQYLDSLRYFAGREESLEVCMLVHTKDRETIAEAIRAYPLFKYRFLDIGEVADRISLKPAPMSSHAEEILVHMWASKGVENHFAAPDFLKFAKYRRLRFATYAATAAILLAGLGVTAFNMQQASLISAENDRRDLQSRGQQSEYQNISNLIRGQISATSAMRDSSLFYRAQANPATPAPGDFLRGVARVWQEFPALRLDQLVWAPHHDGNVSPTVQGSPPAQPLNVRAESKSAGGASLLTSPAQLPGGSATTADADPPLPGTKFEVAVIEGNITGFRGDYREANAVVEKLVARFDREPGFKATVSEFPVDTRTPATLRGKADEPDAPEARFVIRVLRSRGAS
ncbi:MAG: hypothetical protein JNJ55_13605, partial [Betaproteobacteria bacterium]|nr:hypothetical protein [Betaproteobacteria bacterium]